MGRNHGRRVSKTGTISDMTAPWEPSGRIGEGKGYRRREGEGEGEEGEGEQVNEMVECC